MRVACVSAVVQLTPVALGRAGSCPGARSWWPRRGEHVPSAPPPAAALRGPFRSWCRYFVARGAVAAASTTLVLRWRLWRRGPRALSGGTQRMSDSSYQTWRARGASRRVSWSWSVNPSRPRATAAVLWCQLSPSTLAPRRSSPAEPGPGIGHLPTVRD